jgi:hypothetical protein
MNGSQIFRHVLFLGSIVLLAVGLRVGMKEHYAKERRQILDNARQQWFDRMQAGWQGLRYADMAEEAFLESFLSKIDWNELELSEPQRTKLKPRIEGVLLYLKDPKAQDYYRLKTEGVGFRFMPTGEATEFLADYEPLDMEAGSETTEEWIRALFERVRIGSDGPYGIREISFDGVGATLSRTNTPTALLAGPVGRGFTRAEAALDPGFRYGSGGEEGTGGLFFHLSFFARARGTDNVGPVYVSLAWLEEDQQWALSRLITDAMLGMKALF